MIPPLLKAEAIHSKINAQGNRKKIESSKKVESVKDLWKIRYY